MKIPTIISSLLLALQSSAFSIHPNKALLASSPRKHGIHSVNMDCSSYRRSFHTDGLVLNMSEDQNDNDIVMEDVQSSSVADDDDDDDTSKKNVIRKVWSRMFPPKKDSDGLTVGQKLRKMGMSVLLSYGFVSNMSYSVTVSLAWYIHSKRTGLSPLAPGQWPQFLAVYAGFYVFVLH